MATDRAAAERAIAAFLAALGHDPAGSPELSGTPARVVEAFDGELLSGHRVDVAGLLLSESELRTAGAPAGIVGVRGIAVATMCPHHLLPGLGVATVAYLPGERLVGIGTLARLVDAFSRRLVLQESIGENVVQALLRHAGARGAYCRLELRHSCLAARGARKEEATVVTIARAGDPLPDADLASVLTSEGTA